jgi:hypothetical protein
MSESSRSAGPDDTLAAWAREADFAFTGQVLAVGESNLHGVEPDERMATVEVREVALAPNELGDIRGWTVTVELQTPKGVEPGQTITFVGRGSHYGSTVGVTEIGRTTQPASEIQRGLVEAQLRQFDARLQERIRDAEVVLSGQVVSTHLAQQSPDLPGFIEGVKWWNAELWIGSVEKGMPPEDRWIWYPEGGEPEWGAAPKAQPGQTGVWLLRPISQAEGGAPPGGPGPKPEGVHGGVRPDRPKPRRQRRLMAIDPLDYHAISDLPRIRTLLWLAKGP